MRLKSRERRIP